MKKRVIIYESKYGATEQYADWLSDAIQCPAIRADKISPGRLAQYDLLILGTPVYIGKLRLRKWLKQHLTELVKKQVLLFIVCGTSDKEPEEQQRIIRSNLPLDFIARTKIYFLPGRCLPEKISIMDRLLLVFASLMQKDPQIKGAMKQGFDKMDKGQLKPLIQAATEYLKEMPES